MSHPYSLLMNLKGRACLVIGGGHVAERKVRSLLEGEAQVVIISPTFSDKLRSYGHEGKLSLVHREYVPGDCQGDYTLVFAATSSREVNKRVYEEATKLKLWVNIADDPELSTFVVPSVVRRGKLTLSVSTGGASPVLARTVAAQLGASFGEEYEQYLEFLAELRLKVQNWVKDKEVRQMMFKQMLLWEVPAMIRSGTFETWKAELLSALEQVPTPDTVAAFLRIETYSKGDGADETSSSGY
jgi:precorrin-2 dehydrogenase/sirohydrochlorin ferrochelatase